MKKEELTNYLMDNLEKLSDPKKAMKILNEDTVFEIIRKLPTKRIDRVNYLFDVDKVTDEIKESVKDRYQSVGELEDIKAEPDSTLEELSEAEQLYTVLKNQKGEEIYIFLPAVVTENDDIYLTHYLDIDWDIEYPQSEKFYNVNHGEGILEPWHEYERKAIKETCDLSINLIVGRNEAYQKLIVLEYMYKKARELYEATTTLDDYGEVTDTFDYTDDLKYINSCLSELFKGEDIVALNNIDGIHFKDITSENLEVYADLNIQPYICKSLMENHYEIRKGIRALENALEDMKLAEYKKRNINVYAKYIVRDYGDFHSFVTNAPKSAVDEALRIYMKDGKGIASTLNSQNYCYEPIKDSNLGDCEDKGEVYDYDLNLYDYAGDDLMEDKD